MQRFALAAALIAIAPATVVLDNPRVRVFRTVATSLDGVDRAPGVVIALDQATAVWRGMIKVEKDAQKTNAYQENRNLLLSPKAHADSIPGLEIEANDVRCTHGATVSQVDRDELFYCMARGLSRGEAERLIVRGFYQEIFDRIELEPVRTALQTALEARIPE